MEQGLHHFQLQPYKASVSCSESNRLEIFGSVARVIGTLLVNYRIEGDLDTFNWPTLEPSSDRRHGLWQNTCFEFFFAIKGEPGYWEVNFSPNGCWNVYRFAAYREEMIEEPAIKELCGSIVRDSCGLDVSCRLEISRIIEDKYTLEVGVSTVLQNRRDKLSYWALCHPGTKADFHDRKSFTIDIPAVAG